MQRVLRLCIILFFFSTYFAFAAKTVNVMGPLLIGDPTNINSDASKRAFSAFQRQLQQLKEVGIKNITVDVWWGLVQGEDPDGFYWDYYKKISEIIRQEGMQWIPILSHHQLGGNVNDKGSIALPAFIRKELVNSGNDYRYKSEVNGVSEEVISVWGTQSFKKFYSKFWGNFLQTFSQDQDIIAEIIVGLGPSGELIYPSYHQHDKKAEVLEPHFPYRGLLQASSDVAIKDFQRFLRKKYKNKIEKLNGSWHTDYKDFSEITILTKYEEVTAFFNQRKQFSKMGQDFFSWYHGRLLRHGTALLKEAVKVFHNEASAFKDKPIGMKIPGVHWKFYDPFSPRIAELTAGLISTKAEHTHPFFEGDAAALTMPMEWQALQFGLGYRSLFGIIKKLSARYPKSKWHLHFTCGELPNSYNQTGSVCVGGRTYYYDSSHINSGAQSLVQVIGRLAGASGIPVFLENALSSSLESEARLQTLDNNLNVFKYDGVSLLRIDDVVGSNVAKKYCQKWLMENERKE